MAGVAGVEVLDADRPRSTRGCCPTRHSRSSPTCSAASARGARELLQRRARRARSALRRRRGARLPAPRRPTCAPATGASRRRPPTSNDRRVRDHRPGRAQDDDQRPQPRRARVHGRPRGRALADVGERGRGPGGAAGRGPPRARVRRARRARRTALNERIATLLVRPRGWHLTEAHVRVDGEPISASLFDFGLYFFHNAAEALRARLRPLLLPAQAGGAPRGPALERRVHGTPRRRWASRTAPIRATVLIETILAAFEMDEILYELRDHAAGLNAGRWDYIFSVHQEVPDAGRPRAARPRAGDDDRAVHARLHRAARARPATAAARTRSAAWRRSSRAAATRRSTRSR